MNETSDNTHLARHAAPLPSESDRPTPNNGLRLATIDHSNVAAEGGVREVRNPASANSEKEGPVSWMSLPNKTQLIILTLARLSEPLVQTSLQVCLAWDPRSTHFYPYLADSLAWQSYMFYQLKSFDESLPDSTIAAQAGMLGSSFTGAQFLTAMMWGRISDSEKGGRKLVIMIGLIGTSE